MTKIELEERYLVLGDFIKETDDDDCILSMAYMLGLPHNSSFFGDWMVTSIPATFGARFVMLISGGSAPPITHEELLEKLK